ncbi:MAG: hypothetical protein QM679_07105 [Patulibacter sp.]
MALATAAASAVSAVGFHAGPVAAFRDTPAVSSSTDPCVLAPTSFVRGGSGGAASDWCAAVTASTGGSWGADLELPEGTTVAAGAVPSATQVGTASLRSISPLGTVQEDGALYATSTGGALSLVLDRGAASGRPVTIPIGVAGGPYGGTVLTVPPLPAARSTEAGDLSVTPIALTLRLWGTTAAGTPFVTLGSCEFLQRPRMTWRPADPTTAPVALVDPYLLDGCTGRASTNLAWTANSATEPPAPLLPYFATQRAAHPTAGSLGRLREVMVPELATGTFVTATLRNGARRVRWHSSAEADGTATLTGAPQRLSTATRLTLRAQPIGAGTTRLTFRFVLRDGALRAKRTVD